MLGKEALPKNCLFTMHVRLYCTCKTLQNNVLVFILCASEDVTITEFAPGAQKHVKIKYLKIHNFVPN